jgi:hypothetical protein
MSTTRVFSVILYLVFLGGLCVVCFLRQVPGDFDRYIYESLVRGRKQSLEVVYSIVKHSNPRAEVSTVLDSPGHLGQLEPLYAIRPLYIDAIALAVRAGLTFQRAISLISALSLFGIGLLLFGWTGTALRSALLMATPSIVILGRIGTPDALSALIILGSAWAMMREKYFVGIVFLLGSVWVRTDNVLLVLPVVGWLAWNGRLKLSYAGVLAGLALFSVLIINHFSGNYGWGVLFRYSFIGGRSPADVVSHVSLRQYAAAVVRGFTQISGQGMPFWILIGIASWYWLPRASQLRQLLLAVALAAMARFLLFPSPEDRYFAWAYLIVGVCFLEAIEMATSRDGRIDAAGGHERGAPAVGDAVSFSH